MIEKILNNKNFFLLFLCISITVLFFSGKVFLTHSSAQINDSTNISDSTKGDSTQPHNTLGDTIPQILGRRIKNNAFQVGEKLRFKIRYGFIKAGEATMEVKKKQTYQNRRIYLIETTAKSNSTFDIIYKVRDTVQTMIDSQGIFSWKFYKRLREGSYKFDLLVHYNQWFGKANIKMIRYHKDEPLRIKKKEEFILDVPPNVLDILASFYYVRTQNLRVGMPLYVTNHDNKDIYNLKIFIQKKETIKVKAGEFRCIMVHPKLKGEGIFKQKGDLWVWLTDDKYKIPVQMKSAVFFGKVTTELVGIEGVDLPLPSQIK